MSKKKPRQVREPVQVYLDARDRALLEALVSSTGLPRAELIRRGLRKLAGEDLTDRRPGWSLDVLTGVVLDGPVDLSLHHDEYLAEPDE
jgi:hypothetical protein